MKFGVDVWLADTREARLAGGIILWIGTLGEKASHLQPGAGRCIIALFFAQPDVQPLFCRARELPCSQKIIRDDCVSLPPSPSCMRADFI